jgi:CheY-like chemotaxis protein
MITAGSKVLLVDDEEANRDFLGRRLEKRGFTVLYAADGPTAIAIAAEAQIDVVLLDIMMPGMDGYEVLTRLRERHPPHRLPILMVTARTDSTDVIRALELGANDYITKPIDFEVTLARIGRHLMTSLATAEPAASIQPAFIKPAAGSVLARRYRLEASIGSGHFGTVFRARHIDLDLGVAIKVLHDEFADTDEARVRFRREGVLACRVRHRNAVQVTDFGIEGRSPFLVMELLSGQTLFDLMRHKRGLSLARAAEIILPIASVLAEAHRQDIVHRDIKPANIFLHQAVEGETIKVLDFGIARLSDPAHAPSTATVVGTPAYMAPERFQGHPGEASSDIYSLGVVLADLLIGRSFFLYTGKNLTDLITAKMQPIADLSPIAGLCPDPLRELIARMLSLDPAARPTAAELLDRGEALFSYEDADGISSPADDSMLVADQDETRTDFVKRAVSATRPVPGLAHDPEPTTER